MCGSATTLAMPGSGLSCASGSRSNTSRPAPWMVPCCSASISAASSTMRPREPLMKMAPGRISANSRRPIMRSVCAVSGSTTQTKSDPASKSSSATWRAPSAASTSGTASPFTYSTCMPNPSAARRATARPIRPMPSMPMVLPCTLTPYWLSPTLRVQRPALTNSASSTTRRALARISAKIVSAVVSVSTSGVLASKMPRSRR